MSEQQSFWQKIWNLIQELLRSSTKTPNSSEQPQQPSAQLSAAETIKDFVKEEAISFVEDKAVGLIAEYGNMLGSLSPKQKEYVKKVAILKASETSELTFDEVLELGDIIIECQKLQIEISEELSTFWNKVGFMAKEIAIKTGQVGFKLAAKSLVGFLPI